MSHLQTPEWQIIWELRGMQDIQRQKKLNHKLSKPQQQNDTSHKLPLSVVECGCHSGTITSHNLEWNNVSLLCGVVSKIFGIMVRNSGAKMYSGRICWRRIGHNDMTVILPIDMGGRVAGWMDSEAGAFCKEMRANIMQNQIKKRQRRPGSTEANNWKEWSRQNRNFAARKTSALSWCHWHNVSEIIEVSRSLAKLRLAIVNVD